MTCCDCVSDDEKDKIYKRGKITAYEEILHNNEFQRSLHKVTINTLLSQDELLRLKIEELKKDG